VPAPERAPFVEVRAGTVGPFALRVRPGGALLARAVEVARTRAARRRGLLGRRALPPDYALVLVPCRVVHTWGLGGAIDIVFVARSGRVVKVCAAVPPRRVCGSWRAYAAVELAAGAAARAGATVGAYLGVERLRWEGGPALAEGEGAC
jgi:uncharacterized membrane protein (UPF0127 family)